ncbi:MAG TPA: hypothetical protein VFC32_07510, partial [Pseudolabrys sp.]|nr:hypothetical protein [Pseudolabrys sp.]
AFTLFELLRHPVGALRAPAIGAIGGDVVAVLDHHQLDRPLHLARQPLGVLGPDDTVELMMIEDGNHIATNRAYRWRPQSADWMAEQLK